MKFTSNIIFITSNYDRNILYGKGTKPNKRRLDLHIIELKSYVGQIINRYGYERDKKYIEHNTGYLNAVILHFTAGVQSDSKWKPLICFIIFLIILVFIYRLLLAIRNLTLNYIGWTGKPGCHLALAMSPSKFSYARGQCNDNRIGWLRCVDFVSHFLRSIKSLSVAHRPE